MQQTYMSWVRTAEKLGGGETILGKQDHLETEMILLQSLLVERHSFHMSLGCHHLSQHFYFLDGVILLQWYVIYRFILSLCYHTFLNKFQMSAHRNILRQREQASYCESAHLVSRVCFLENQSFTTPFHSYFYMAKLYNIFGLFLTYPVYTLKDIVSSPALAERFVPSVRPHHPYASDWNVKSNVSSPLRSQACGIIKLRVLPRFAVSGTCFFHGACLYQTRM